MSLDSKALTEVYRILQCQICTELMSSPFVLSCGHSYCYNCAFQWLHSHRTCPTCRKRIWNKPVLAYTLKEVSDLLVRYRDNVTPDQASSITLLERQLEKDDVYKAHTGDLFPGLFREHADRVLGGRVADSEDHVMRCIRCHWEVEGPECNNCGYAFSDGDQAFDDNVDDLATLSEDDGSLDDGPNEYDLDDSFVVADDAVDDEEMSISTHSGARRSSNSRILISSDDDPSDSEDSNHSLVVGRVHERVRHDETMEGAVSISSSDDDGRATEADDMSLPSEDLSESADDSIEFHGFEDQQTDETHVEQVSRRLRQRRIMLDSDSDD